MPLPPVELQPAPVAVPLQASAPAPELAAAVPAAEGALAPAAVAVAVAEERKGWPCRACGDLVAFEHLTCTTCGAKFMPSAGAPSLALPGLGQVESSGQRAMVMVGGGFIVMCAMVALFFVLSFFV